MFTSPTALSYLKPWLPLVAATLAAVSVVGAQTPETELAGSAPARSGNIIGKVTAGKGASVVWVEALPGKTFPAPDTSLTISQKALRFVPHLLIAPAGTTVGFLNGDDVQHNIFWPAISGNRKLSHSLGTWPKGETRAFRFTTPGVVPLWCNVHPEMSAYIIVTPTPYHAETDDSGSFKIADVPEGHYTVTAWHEGYKTQSKPVVVGDNVSIAFTLTK